MNDLWAETTKAPGAEPVTNNKSINMSGNISETVNPLELDSSNEVTKPKLEVTKTPSTPLLQPEERCFAK